MSLLSTVQRLLIWMLSSFLKEDKLDIINILRRYCSLPLWLFTVCVQSAGCSANHQICTSTSHSHSLLCVPYMLEWSDAHYHQTSRKQKFPTSSFGHFVQEHRQPGISNHQGCSKRMLHPIFLCLWPQPSQQWDRCLSLPCLSLLPFSMVEDCSKDDLLSITEVIQM